MKRGLQRYLLHDEVACIPALHEQRNSPLRRYQLTNSAFPPPQEERTSPLYARSAQDWFNHQPDDTAKSIINKSCASELSRPWS